MAGLRLLCRAHNQFEAERTYGAGFMARKREQARRAVDARRATDTRRTADTRPAVDAPRATETLQHLASDAGSVPLATITAPPAPPAIDEHAADIVAGLRGLRYKVDEARQAAAYSATTTSITLEARMRAALQYLAPRARPQKPS